MPDFRIKGARLEIENASYGLISLEFSWPIAQVLDARSVYIVRTQPDPGSCFNQNVSAVDKSGNIVWKVRPRTHVYEDSPYTNVEENGDKVLLLNWDGLTVTFDPATLREEAEVYGR